MEDRQSPLTFVIVIIIYISIEKCKASASTFQHEGLTCSRCPPGQHMVQHCTKDHDTQCAPCSASHYTQYWNYLKKCQYCNIFCKENQNVKHECNATHNRVCECKDGYFWEYEFCTKQKTCLPGYGVKTAGTPYSSTICRKCARGFFSSVTSTIAQCKRHTNCTELGLKLDIPGTAWHDNLCSPCQPSGSEEDTTECEKALFNFVARQKLGQRKVFSLGKALLNETKRNLLQTWNDKEEQQQIMLLFHKWKIQQSADVTVEALVKILTAAKLNKVVKKMSRKFLRQKVNAMQEKCAF
ncbi:tumor necrosis factor receptor superfamily member 11B-like isoform X2 [Rhincodon typus]|uniref:tumor necrosis factor receptor superfamily member 11B-like isoform X2 n=1 Tax=Rhincodon typus TaxID=259920 RepID=UPI00202F08A9|nr:tumor necrosis factor receptor superfamily member 11B-like isoform X2 [Rhincodon typus]